MVSAATSCHRHAPRLLTLASLLTWPTDIKTELRTHGDNYVAQMNASPHDYCVGLGGDSDPLPTAWPLLPRRREGGKNGGEKRRRNKMEKKGADEANGFGRDFLPSACATTD